MDGYATMLKERGYSYATILMRLRAVCALTLSMGKRGKTIEALNEEMLQQFCKKNAKQIGLQAGAFSRDLLEYLRNEKVVAPVRASLQVLSSTALLVRRFEKYLLEVRGLQANTVASIVPTARVFLRRRFGKKEVSVAQLKAKDVMSFVVHHAKAKHPATAARMASALRTFCRFLHAQGETKTNLAAAVPSVAHWGLSELPQHLTMRQVDDMLKTCERGTPLGKRDFAILLLLSRLGLRVGEVAFLRLTDIDWERGEIRVCGKSERRAQLPLPEDVGKALVEYLQYGRAECNSPFVFLRMTAPHGGLGGPSAIGSVVRRAMERAGITGIRGGGHLLRHTLAKRMLEEKFTLFEISEVLRHKDIKTTAIYAKLDTDTLHALAQPWPGGAR
jgi:site-specific recombinase XerD